MATAQRRTAIAFMFNSMRTCHNCLRIICSYCYFCSFSFCYQASYIGWLVVMKKKLFVYRSRSLGILYENDPLHPANNSAMHLRSEKITVNDKYSNENKYI